MNERYTFTPTIVRDLIAAWLDDGWLEVADAARRRGAEDEALTSIGARSVSAK